MSFRNGKSLLMATILLITSLAGCGGGSSDSGMLIEGTLTEAGSTDHNLGFALKHTNGQRVENVQICALGECSTSDAQGQWGFEVKGSFNGGNVLFTLSGHGIETTTTVDIPSGASEIFLDFQHVEGGAVRAEHITVDGETSHHEDDEDTHE